MTKSLSRTTLNIAVMTFISRILGFIRDIIIANYFGASASFDAFLVAFKIPNFFRRLFAEGAFSQAFIPILNTYKVNKSREKIKIFLNNIAGVLLFSLTFFCGTGMLLAFFIVQLFAPGFSENHQILSLATQLLRITFPYLLLISFTSLYAGILNSYNNFIIPAITPALLNISMIGSCLLFSAYFKQPIYVLAWGVLLGGIVQFIFQMPFLYKLKLLPFPQFFGDNLGVKNVLKKMLPAIFGVSVMQINILIDTIFASFLVHGSLSWLYYSDRLIQLPLGIFGVALSTVILPKLSYQYAQNNNLVTEKTINWSLKFLSTITIPAVIGLIVLAKPIILTLFHHGKFTLYDVLQSKYALIAYAIGLWFFITNKVLTAIFYARQNFSIPVRNATISVICNIILSLILIQFLHHVGLALALSISSMINTILLLRWLMKNKIYTKYKKLINYSKKLIYINAILLIIINIINPSYNTWINFSSIQRYLVLISLIIFIVMLYLLLLYIFKLLSELSFSLEE